MVLTTAIFMFGALLFLIGLVGKIKAQEIDIGSSNTAIRVVSLLLGISLIGASLFLHYSFDSPEKKQQQRTPKSLQSKNTHERSSVDNYSTSIDSSSDFKKTKQRTIEYWNSMGELNEKYDQDEFTKSIADKMSGAKNRDDFIEAVKIIPDYLKRILRDVVDIDDHDVDEKLVSHTSETISTSNELISKYQFLINTMKSVQFIPESDSSRINAVEKQINSLFQEIEKESMEFSKEAEKDDEKMRVYLSKKYDHNFKRFSIW